MFHYKKSKQKRSILATNVHFFSKVFAYSFAVGVRTHLAIHQSELTLDRELYRVGMQTFSLQFIVAIHKWSKSTDRRGCESVWAGHLATGNTEFSHKLHWSTSWCFNVFYAMGTGLTLLTANLSATIRPESTGLSTVTLCHRCFSAVTTEWIYTWRKSPPSCQNPIQPEVMSSRSLSVQRNTQGVRIIMKSLCYTNSPPLSLFIQEVSTNIISVQCRYCEHEMCHRLIFLLQ